jgi:hypothetical protein
LRAPKMRRRYQNGWTANSVWTKPALFPNLQKPAAA